MEQAQGQPAGAYPSSTVVTLSRTNPAEELSVWVVIHVAEAVNCCLNGLEILEDGNRAHIVASGGAASGQADESAYYGVTVSFAAGASTAEFTISSVDDSAIEGDQILQIEIRTPTTTPDYYYTVGSPGSATVTLHDNDNTAAMLETLLTRINNQILTWHTTAGDQVNINATVLVQAINAYVNFLEANEAEMQVLATAGADISAAIGTPLAALGITVLTPIPGDEAIVLAGIAAVIIKNAVQANLPSTDYATGLARLSDGILQGQQDALGQFTAKKTEYQQKKDKILEDFNANLVSLDDAFCRAVALQVEIDEKLKVDMTTLNVITETAKLLLNDARGRNLSLYYDAANGVWKSDNISNPWGFNGQDYVEQMNTLDPTGSVQE